MGVVGIETVAKAIGLGEINFREEKLFRVNSAGSSNRKGPAAGVERREKNQGVVRWYPKFE